MKVSALLLATSGSSLGFGGTSDSLNSTLDFLGLLSGLLTLFNGPKGISSEEMLHVVLLSGVKAIIDESKTGRSSTTEFELESIDGNLLDINLVLLGNVLLDLSLGDVDLGSVDDFDAQLFSLKERVVDNSLSEKSDFSSFFGHNN